MNRGTKVEAVFLHSHIDRVPLGNMPETICAILMYGKDFDLLYKHQTDQGKITFDTREIRKILQETPLTNPDVMAWISNHLSEELETIYSMNSIN